MANAGPNTNGSQLFLHRQDRVVRTPEPETPNRVASIQGNRFHLNNFLLNSFRYTSWTQVKTVHILFVFHE